MSSIFVIACRNSWESGMTSGESCCGRSSVENMASTCSNSSAVEKLESSRQEWTFEDFVRPCFGSVILDDSSFDDD
jgi:hypothetical protein